VLLGVNETCSGEALDRNDTVREPDVRQYGGMQEITLKLATLDDATSEYSPENIPILL